MYESLLVFSSNKCGSWNVFFRAGYHSKWNSQVAARHPNLWTVIRQMKDEQRRAASRSIRQADRGQLQPLPRRKWRNLQRRVKRLKRQYRSGVRTLDSCSVRGAWPEQSTVQQESNLTWLFHLLTVLLRNLLMSFCWQRTGYNRIVNWLKSVVVLMMMWMNALCGVHGEHVRFVLLWNVSDSFPVQPFLSQFDWML